MNKLIGRILLAMALAGCWSVGAQAQTRVATIDGKKVTTGYWKTKEAVNALKDREKELSKELEDLKTDIKKGQDDYKKLLEDANDQAVSPDEREKRKQAAENKLKSVQQLNNSAGEFLQNARANLKGLDERMSERIEEKVRAAVGSLARSKGYDLVLDATARGPDNKLLVLYAKEDTKDDLTTDVLKQLNSDAPPEPAKSPAKPEEKKDPKK